jgi:hypothetical protein
MRFRVGLVVLVVLCVALLRPRYVDAQDSPITVTAQSMEGKLQGSLTFRLTASSTAGNIVSVRLRSRQIADNDNLITIRDFVAGPQVEIEQVIDIRQFWIAPFQTLLYHWEITDDAGNVLKTPLEAEIITDDSQDWQKLTEGSVNAYWYGQAEQFGTDVLTVASTTINNLSRTLGYASQYELNVVMFNSVEDMCAIFPANGCPQDMLQSVPFFFFGNVTTVIGNGNYPVIDAISEGATMILLAEMLDQQFEQVPVWFWGSFATLNLSQETLTGLLQEARSIAGSNQLMRLFELDDFMWRGFMGGHRNQQVLISWRAQVASLGQYLYTTYGVEPLVNILNKVKTGGRFDTVFQETLGTTFEEVELGWRASLGLTADVPTLLPTETPLPSITPIFRPSPTYPPTPAPKS